ncbi:hypothetical protein Tco_1362503 [Tanacetum coccineum]
MPCCLEEQIRCLDCRDQYDVLSEKVDTSYPTSGYDVSVDLFDQGVGSTSGIRACALRNFDLGKMELENSQNNALAKLPMLKLGEYEMWEIRIKQYFQIQDYALWEVIENGNSWVPIPELQHQKQFQQHIEDECPLLLKKRFATE